MSHLGRNVSHMDRTTTPEAESRALASVISGSLASAGISLRSAAEATGIPTSTLSRRLGGNSPLLYTELAALATLLGTTVKELADQAGRRAA